MSAGIREAIELATPQRQCQAQQHTTPPRCPAPLPIFLLLLLLLLFLLLLLLLHLFLLLLLLLLLLLPPEHTFSTSAPELAAVLL